MTITTMQPRTEARNTAPSIVPTRRAPVVRNRGRVAAGALLLAASALAAVLVYGNLGHRRSVLVMTRTVQPGAVIEATDLTTARVATDAGVETVGTNERSRVIGRRAAVALTPGSLLVSRAIAGGPIVAAGSSVTGAVLKPGHYPLGLRAGEAVFAVVMSDPIETTTRTRHDPVAATVVAIEAQRDGGLAVSLAVPAADAPSLAIAGAQGRMTIVTAPR